MDGGKFKDAIRRFRERRSLRLKRKHARLDGWQNVPYGILEAAGIEVVPGTKWKEAWEIAKRIGLDESCVEYDENGIAVSARPKYKDKSGKKKQIGHVPWDYENIKYGDVDDNKGHAINNFASAGRKTDHEKRHAAEFGISVKEYRKRIVEFLEKPLTNTMEEMTVEMGQGRFKIFRYDYSTNEFGVIGAHGERSTYYPPNEGSEWWEKEVMIYGKRKND